MIVEAAWLNAHLNLPGGDETLLTEMSRAAQAHIEKLLGFNIEQRYPDAMSVPSDLKQAVKLLVGHWYENREDTIVGLSMSEIPHGVWAIVNEHREYSFDG